MSSLTTKHQREKHCTNYSYVFGVDAASDVEPVPVEREACLRGEAAPSPPPRRAVCPRCLVSG
jgi:hypothetical protein